MQELIREAVHIGVRFEIVVLGVMTVGLAWNFDPLSLVTLSGALVTYGGAKK